MSRRDILGIILSGGLSTRMGEDKSLKKISGISLIEWVSNRASNQVDKVIINSNQYHKIFDNLNLETVLSDCMPGNLGPLVGVLTGLKWAVNNSKYKWLMSFPIDCPFFPKNIVQRFVEESQNSQIVMAEGSVRIHPVFSMWRVNSRILQELELFLNNGERKIDIFTKKFKTRVVKFSEFGYDPFLNVNTMSELQKAQKIHSKYFRTIK